MNISQFRLPGIIMLSSSLLFSSSVDSLSAATITSTSIEAGALTTTQAQTKQRPLLLVETRNNCQKNESLFVAAETKDFWVNICGGAQPNTYIGVDKSNGKFIRLPIKRYDPQGNMFEALNGNVSYILIRGTAKGNFLTVIEGKREILKQPIIRWQ
jgi:hypothetical protein